MQNVEFALVIIIIEPTLTTAIHIHKAYKFYKVRLVLVIAKLTDLIRSTKIDAQTCNHNTNEYE